MKLENIKYEIFIVLFVLVTIIGAILKYDYRENSRIIEQNNHFIIYEDTVNCNRDTVVVKEIYKPILKPSIGIDGQVHIIFD